MRLCALTPRREDFMSLSGDRSRPWLLCFKVGPGILYHYKLWDIKNILLTDLTISFVCVYLKKLRTAWALDMSMASKRKEAVQKSGPFGRSQWCNNNGLSHQVASLATLEGQRIPGSQVLGAQLGLLHRPASPFSRELRNLWARVCGGDTTALLPNIASGPCHPEGAPWLCVLVAAPSLLLSS